MFIFRGAIRTLLIFVFVGSANPANALFKGFPILGPIEEGVEKGVKEAGNGIRDLVKEGEKVVKKTFKEIGNAAEDIRILVEEGKCGGDICTALSATAEYVEANIKDTGKAVEEAGRRLSEGKPIDALWHLSIAPYDIQQENAARAAMKSSVIRAVGQVAAGAYGGPGGAAAYAAWLTYHQTGGDLELALKAGAIAGATAYAMQSISKDVEFADVIKSTKADEILQRAVATGAISGTAVALAGGSEEQIKQAFTTGALTSVIRDGYKELTKANLEDNMKASTGAAYCLKADPNAATATGERLGCLPEPGAYVPKDGNAIRYNSDGTIDVRSIDTDQNGLKIDITKLKYERPHVGSWSEVANEGVLGTGETSGFMTGISRIPGMNGMAVAHDIFDDKYNPGGVLIETAVRVGSIAPFVVMTYEGAGLGVQEAIRNAAVNSTESQEAPVATGTEAGDPAQPTVEQQKPSQSSLSATGVAANSVPVEIRHLYCKRGAEPVKNILLEVSLKREPPKRYSERVCRIDQHLRGDDWAHLWHAHYQKNFCITKFNELAVRLVQRDYTCFTNIGVRFDPEIVDVQTAQSGVDP